MTAGSNISGKISGPQAHSAAARGEPRMNPVQAQSFLRRGYDAMRRGNFSEAGACCNLVLQHFPQAKEAHFLVGLVGVESGEWSTAKRAFRNVVSLDEGHVAAWAQLARCCVTLGQYQLADEALASARAIPSEDPLVLDVIGNVYSLLGDQQEALAWFDRALEKTKSGYFELSRAKVLTFLGRFDEAREALDRVLAEKPDAGIAHWMRSRLDKALDGNHVAAMQALVARMPDAHPDRAFFHYAIGKELEDLEAWDEAFEAIETGAKVRRDRINFDEEAETGLFETLKKTFDKGWLANCGDGCDDPAPIFVVGQPRTGTTLIERIITAHSEVESAGELQQFAMSVKRLSGISSPLPMTAEIIDAVAGKDMAALGHLYLETSKTMRGTAARFVDKMPVNYLYLPLIMAALPNARIIHVARDPMDSCFASYKQLFADAYFHSYDQEEMARHHVRYRQLMDHWQHLLGDRFLTVSYEHTVADVDANARKIIDFLGLEWQDACAEFHIQSSAVATASAAQVREKSAYTVGGALEKFEQHLGPMKSVLMIAGLVEEPA